MKFLASKMLDFTTETGDHFPDEDAARVLSQAIDEDTLGRVDGHEDLTIEKFAPHHGVGSSAGDQAPAQKEHTLRQEQISR